MIQAFVPNAPRLEGVTPRAELPQSSYTRWSSVGDWAGVGRHPPIGPWSISRHDTTSHESTKPPDELVRRLAQMGLFDMSDGTLHLIEPTTFAAERVLERADLQAAIKNNIGLLGDDLLVVAEEFGDFSEAHRRIDLLCIDHEARPVVVELKRTTDGGHMELQALRYAAMISAMTFEELLATFERYLSRQGEDASDARGRLAAWLEDVDGEDAVIRRDVRIILASADFGKEIMTTSLWLNDIFGTDIRCVRMTPYRIENRLLLNVEQVIPLPEAEELTIRLRRREVATRAISTSSQDWTPYVITTPDGVTEPLRKRRAILAVAHAVHAAGASAASIREVLGSRFLGVEGRLEGDSLEEAFVAVYPKATRLRWFFDDPIFEDERTWVVSNQWGRNTEPALEGLVRLLPDAGISYAAVSADA